MALSRQVANNPDVRLLTVMKYEPDEERVIRTRLRLSGLLAPTRRGNSTTRHLSNGPNANDAAQKSSAPSLLNLACSVLSLSQQ